MKSTTSLLIWGSVAVGLIGIYAYIQKQVAALSDACFTVMGAVIHTISFDNMNFDLMMSIKNKSDIAFTVTNQNYNIYVNKMLVATIDNKENIKIVANGTSTMKINIDFNPQDLLKKGIENITALIKNKDNLVLEIRGSISIGAGIFSYSNYRVDEKLLMKELFSNTKSTTKC